MKNKILFSAAVFYTASLVSLETWNLPGGGNWGIPGNWNPAGVPNSVGETTTFGAAIGANSIINLDISPVVGTMNFDNANNYTISPTGSNFLTLNVNAANAAINVTNVNGNGAHIIGAPMTLAQNLTITQNIAGIPFTISGVMSGPGSVTVVGSPQVVFSGANTYAGGTIINGFLQAGAANVIPANGAVKISGFFNLNGNNQNIGTLSGNGNIGLGSAVLTTNTSTTSTYSGIISGTGGLTVLGSGVLILINSNTYSGGTTITSGTLRIGATNALLTTGNVVVNSPGVLNLNGFSQQVANLTGTGSVTLDTATTVLGVGPTSNQIFSGVISGPGGVVKNGGFTWTLSGVNTFTGGITVGAGVLQLSVNNALSPTGEVNLAGGSLDISPSSQQTIGTLQGSGGINLGTAQLTVNGLANATYSGVMGATAGSLIYQGPMTLTLSGVNLYTGGTTINGGRLQLGIANALPSGKNLTINSPGIFDLNGFNQTIGALSGSGNTLLGAATLTLNTTQTSTYSGSISGGGSLIFQGPGTLTLSGSNSYSGGTTVSGGTLQGNTSSLQGAINNTAALIFNQTTDGTFLGTLTGTGSLIKSGSANLTLVGVQTQNSTTVNAGTLTIESGSNLTSAVNVSSEAFLAGTGTVNGNVINQGTVLLDLGNLRINGNYNQASGSTLSASVTPTTSGSLTVSGTTTIGSGAKVNINPQKGSYTSIATYPLISSAGGPVTGAFSALSFTNPFFDGSFVYNNPIGTVALVLQLVPFSDVIKGGNAGKIAKCLVPQAIPAGSELLYIIQKLIFLPISQVRNALNQIQPSQLTGLKLTEENNLILARTAISQRVDDLYRTPCTTSTDPWSFWTNISGDVLSQDRQGTSHGYDVRTITGALGADRRFFDRFFLGLSGAYNHSWMKWEHAHGHARIGSYYTGPYLAWFNHRFFATLSGLGTFNQYNVSRHISFPGVNRSATSQHHGYGAIGHLDLGVLFHPAIDMTLSPFGGVDYLYLHELGYKEHGARSLSLKIDSSHASLWRTEVGLKMGKCATLKHSKWTHDLKLSWIHQQHLEGEHLTARLPATRCSFMVKGMEPNRDFLDIATGLTAIVMKERLSAAIRYEGKFGDGISDNTGYFQLIFRF